jgi:HAD superfamily phosphoserine phosphatase-like hydrolase
MKALAVFDLCDTLYAENTTLGFLRFHAASRSDPSFARIVDRWSLRRSPFFLFGEVARQLTGLDLPKRRMIAALRGESWHDLRRSARCYASELLPLLSNPVIHERLDAHRCRGDVVLIISASLDIVVEPIARKLGAGFEAARLGFANGRCTGRIERDLSGRKLPVVLGKLEESGARLIVYSDNRSDRALLRAADEAYAVIPAGKSFDRWAGDAVNYVRL